MLALFKGRSDPSNTKVEKSNNVSISASQRKSIKWILGAMIGASMLHHTSAQSSLSATPATSQSGAGDSLSPVLGPSYAGVGIEPVHLFDYLGRATANNLTYNLLNTLGSYTGVPPHLRIGGNSGDNIIYKSDSQYNGYQIYSNPSASGQGTPKTDADIIGQGYFQVMNLVPKGTPITYGLNLAYSGSDYLSQISNQASAAVTILKNATLVGFEVGNEPDLYVQNGYRQSGWTSANFGTEWAARVSAVYSNVLQQNNLPSNFFEPPATATTATKTGQQYRISNLINTDVATQNGIYVAGWNQHDYYYYVNVSDYTLTLSLLLDMSTLVNQLNEWRGQAGQAKVTGKPYYLREFGSVGPTGLQGITDVFANTLWTLNALLYCATIQVNSVQIHMTSNSYASPWQPIPFNGEQPHVRTTYYAFAALAQVIGKSCTTRVAPVTLTNVPSDYKNNVNVYAVYQFGNLRSLVMINTKASYSGSNGGTMNFQLSLPSQSGQTLHLSTLTAQGVDSTSNTTWNGISYERSGDGTPTIIDSSDHTVQISSSGSISIPVRDSQVVVAALNGKLGDEQNVDTSACASLANNPEGGENTGQTQSGSDSSAPVFGAGNPAPTFKATGGFSSSAKMDKIIPAAFAIFVPTFLCVLSQVWKLV